MKQTLLPSVLSLAATLALATSAFQAGATPYASGINTSTPGSISFILNEDADNVKVLFDSATSTNDLGAQVKGTITFSLGAATNYQIVVSKKSLNGYTAGAGAGGTATTLQISTDTNPLINTYYPIGVAANYNPKSPYFGRVYIANDEAGLTSTFIGRNTTVGIYLLNADQTDAVGQGDTARTAGLTFSAATEPNASPYRIRVGEDDNLYVCDRSDSNGNLYRVDPDVSDASGIFALKALTGTATVPVGAANNHGSVQAVYVSGSLGAGNLTIYTMDQDLQSDKTTTTLTQLNSLWQYTVNAGPLPYNSDPTRLWTAGTKEGINFTAQIMDLDRAPDGKFFITTQRSNGSEAGLIVRNSTSTTTLFNSELVSVALNKPATVNDYLKNSGAVTVSRDDKWVAVANRTGGTVWIVPLTNGVPDLSKRNLLTTSPANNNNNAVAFDAAGNLYLVNNAMEAMRILSPGGTSITTYSNDSSGANASFSVVRIDPDIYTPPQNFTTNAGGTATFTTTATGSGNLTYQWKLNGVNISGATKSAFTRANVQQATAGSYTVVVTSAVTGNSITSGAAVLTVNDIAPQITVDLPATLNVNAGTTNTFSITTIGTDPRAYQWYFNNAAISGATNASYTRPNLQTATDQGSYYVVVSNAIAPYTATSTTCVLTINESAVVITANPANQTAGAGANVTFTVGSYGTDPRSYQWQLNSGSGFADIPGATSISLTLTNVQVEDTGKSFQVNINNSQGGQATSTAATLTVTNKVPVIITQPALAIVDPGQNTNFTVVAQGENPLSYQWRKNGVNIATGTDSTLPINAAQLSDAGFYSVVVTSSGGTVTSASAQLVVTQTPAATGTGTGLRGEYWTVQLKTFTNNPTLTRLDANVDTNYATGSPDPSISVDRFSVRWSGQVQPLYSQDYTFYTASDDGSRLWVNGILVVDRWIPQGITETAGSTNLSLVAGQKYDLVMEYFEQTSTAEVHLRWSSASQIKQAIPMTQLYPADAPVQPKLTSTVLGTDLVLQWMGSYSIQHTFDLSTAFSDIVTVTNIAPYTNGPLSQPQEFLRLKAH